MNTNKTVTVQDMINSLMQFPMDAPIEIAVKQANKKYPVAYIAPSESSQVDNMYANMFDGKNVRITCMLPTDSEGKSMITSFKKLGWTITA
jgi:hypothetical protein